MPRTHLLDTSVYSQPVRRSISPAIAARLESLPEEDAAVSSICEAELLFGLRKHGSPQMRDRFDAILRGRYPVIPVDEEVAATYADLRGDCEDSGITVQDMDLLIAATAKTHGLIVATLNTKHFSKIPGLSIEDWSQPATP
ncbi:MAG: type II toxin-antitoxin system VapC family toxin [Synoicihabitans sp.]